MSAAGVSSNLVPPVFPSCPTCNKEMSFISVSPTCQTVIYGYLCRNDGDRLSWESRQPDHRGDRAAPPVPQLAGPAGARA
jgi:hypothetical protein